MNLSLRNWPALSLLLLCSARAEATTIDPRIWQQLVVDADFVGVVECVTAGGIVAEYAVLDSWKGAPVGERFRLRIAVNYWEPQFPIALVGERFLVTAFRSRPSDRMLSTTLGGGVPLWARDLEADYYTPLFQGRVRLPLPDTDYALSALGTTETGLDRFEASVKDLLGAPPEEREARVLKALTRKYLVERAGDEPLPAAVLEGRNGVESATGLEGVLKGLARLADAEDPRWARLYTAILAQGGGERSLEYPLPEGVAPVIRVRLGLDEAPERRADRGEAEISTAELEGLDVEENLEVLIRRRPEIVVEYLRSWRNQDDGWTSVDRGYVLGSFFAISLEDGRERRLRSLLDARDPFIRVAAAVYLALENEREGLRALEQFQRLEGDPGVWAALALGRRGDRSVVPRLLDAFDEAGPSNMAGVPHRNLQKRVLVLLSNSARESGVPQPLPSDFVVDRSGDEWTLEIQARLDEWWRRYGTRVRLTDPWFEELREKRVD